MDYRFIETVLAVLLLTVVSTPHALAFFELPPRDFSLGVSSGAVIVENRIVHWGQPKGRWLERLEKPYKVALGDGRKCAIDGEGLKCSFFSENPEHYDIENPIDVAASRTFHCAINEVSAKCWTYDPETPWQYPAPELKNPRIVDTSEAHACALDDLGVHCWGPNSRLVRVPYLRNPTKLVTEGDMACALDRDHIVCWGEAHDSARFYPVTDVIDFGISVDQNTGVSMLYGVTGTHRFFALELASELTFVRHNLDHPEFVYFSGPYRRHMGDRIRFAVDCASSVLGLNCEGELMSYPVVAIPREARDVLNRHRLVGNMRRHMDEVQRHAEQVYKGTSYEEDFGGVDGFLHPALKHLENGEKREVEFLIFFLIEPFLLNQPEAQFRQVIGDLRRARSYINKISGLDGLKAFPRSNLALRVTGQIIRDTLHNFRPRLSLESQSLLDQQVAYLDRILIRPSVSLDDFRLFSQRFLYSDDLRREMAGSAPHVPVLRMTENLAEWYQE